jgi:plastocyanin
MSALIARRRAALLLAVLPVAPLAAEPAANVTIDNFTFTPALLTVPRGTRVIWTNRDDMPHTVVSDATPPAFRSHGIDTDETFDVMFDRPGRWGYFCAMHAHMRGAVIVQ